jgi:hypothetical protein
MVTEGIGSAYDVFANKASKLKNYGINEIGEDDMAKVYRDCANQVKDISVIALAVQIY